MSDYDTQIASERNALRNDLNDLERSAPPSPGGVSRTGSLNQEGRILTQQQIHDIFDFYANFGRSAVMSYQDSMDNFMFTKFAKECPGLLDRNVTRTEIDIIFTKAKPKFERRLDFEHFLDALAAVAERKFPSFSPADGLRLLIVNHLSPHYDIVLSEMNKTGETEVPLHGVFKKLYDPKSYTGVYAERFRSGDGRINGEADNRPGRSFAGSTNTGSNETIHNIDVLMRPNLRGGGTMMAPANHLLYKRDPSSRSESPSLSRIHSSASISGNLTSTGSVRSFSPRSSFRRSPSARAFDQNVPSSPNMNTSFRSTPQKSTPSVAVADLGIDQAALAAAMSKAQSGDNSELLALTAKLASVMSTPGNAQNTPRSNQNNSPARSTSARSVRSSRTMRIDPQSAAEALEGPLTITQDDIRTIFEFYANFGRSAVMSYQESMDNFMFNKFSKECPGLLDSSLTKTDVDLIFTKAKPKFERRLHFSHFLDALAAIAEKKFPEYAPADGLKLLIVFHLTPLYEIVLQEMEKTGDTEVPLQGVFKKLYDPKSYTGVYAERFRSGDGRINGDADNRPGRQFLGNTNTGTDEIIHSIDVLMRPNLRGGSMMVSRNIAAGGSPRPMSAKNGNNRSFRSTSPSMNDNRSVASSFISR